MAQKQATETITVTHHMPVHQLITNIWKYCDSTKSRRKRKVIVSRLIEPKVGVCSKERSLGKYLSFSNRRI